MSYKSQFEQEMEIRRAITAEAKLRAEIMEKVNTYSGVMVNLQEEDVEAFKASNARSKELMAQLDEILGT